MARYCFYCGRELNSTEKCFCREGKGTRTASDSTTAQGAAGSSGGASGSASSRAKTNTKAKSNRTDGNPKNARSGASGGFFQGIRNRFKQFSDNLQRPSQTARPMRSSRFKVFTDQVRILFPTFSAQLKNVSEYVLHPASRIQREALRPSRRSTIPTILIVSLLSGLLGMMFAQAGSPLFDSIMFLLLGSNIGLLYVQPILSMLTFSILTLIFIFTMALCFYLAATFSRHKTTFRKTLDVLSISFVYLIFIEGVLIVSMCMGSRGSFSMILFSILLMSVSHFISFRSAYALKEDMAFMFLLFVYSFCYIIFLNVLDLTAFLVMKL